MENLKIEYVPIDSITPYENNAKLHPAEQIEQIKRSIQDNGMNDPIGIWHDQVVEGHGRLIDADAAVKDIQYEIFEYKMDGLKGTPMPTEHLGLMKNWIADEDICPTIVPAERRET